MAYHVEIRHGRRWAREFNLSEAELRESVLDPWVRGGPVRLGDREWEPADCDLRVLEGPELSPPELAFGRGWGVAERSGSDVARELIGGAARRASRVAVLAETDASRSWIAAALGELGLESVAWSKALLGGGEGSRPAAVVLAVESAEPRREWLYEAGAAVGALGGRAVVVRAGGGGSPPELATLETIEPGEELAARLAAALERVGI